MLWKAQMQCLIEIVVSQQSHMRHMPSRSLGIVHPHESSLWQWHSRSLPSMSTLDLLGSLLPLWYQPDFIMRPSMDWLVIPSIIVFPGPIRTIWYQCHTTIQSCCSFRYSLIYEHCCCCALGSRQDAISSTMDSSRCWWTRSFDVGHAFPF